MKITPLEKRIIGALLDGDDPTLSRLREQYALAMVITRDFTGCGFFTHFCVPDTASRVTPPSFVVNDIFLEVRGTENGASALLFIRDGLIDFLEVVATTGDWPQNPEITSIQSFHRKGIRGTVKELVPQQRRDLDVIRRAWKRTK